MQTEVGVGMGAVECVSRGSAMSLRKWRPVASTRRSWSATSAAPRRRPGCSAGCIWEGWPVVISSRCFAPWWSDRSLVSQHAPAT